MNSFIIDIDGTLCPIKNKNQKYEDLIPYKEVIEKIKELKKQGYKIRLYTSRNMRTYNGDLQKILMYTKPILEKWLEKWQIPYDELIFGKPWPGVDGFYVDDKAIRPQEFINYKLEDIEKICEKDRLIQ